MIDDSALVEIYVSRSTEKVIAYTAAGVTQDGKPLPEDVIFVTSFDIEDVLDGTAELELTPLVQTIRKLKC